MYRPDENCKLCDKEFETEFTVDSAWEHHAARRHGGFQERKKKTFSAKFIPCLHQMVCTDCTKNEKYTECPFRSEPIRRVTYKQYYWDVQRNLGGMWRSDILYSNSN